MGDERYYYSQEEPAEDKEEEKKEREDAGMQPPISDAQELLGDLADGEGEEGADNDNGEAPGEENREDLPELKEKEGPAERPGKKFYTSDEQMVLERADEGLVVRINREGKQELDELLLSQEEREGKEDEDGLEVAFDEDAELEKKKKFDEKDEKIKEQFRKARQRQRRHGQEDAQEEHTPGIEETTPHGKQEENPYDVRIRERYGGGYRVEEPYDITKDVPIPVEEDAEAAAVPSMYPGMGYNARSAVARKKTPGTTTEIGSRGTDAAYPQGIAQEAPHGDSRYDEMIRQRFSQDRYPGGLSGPVNEAGAHAGTDGQTGAGSFREEAGAFRDAPGAGGFQPGYPSMRGMAADARRSTGVRRGDAAQEANGISSGISQAGTSGFEERKETAQQFHTSASRFDMEYNEAAFAGTKGVAGQEAGTAPVNTRMYASGSGENSPARLTAGRAGKSAGNAAATISGGRQGPESQTVLHAGRGHAALEGISGKTGAGGAAAGGIMAAGTAGSATGGKAGGRAAPVHENAKGGIKIVAGDGAETAGPGGHSLTSGGAGKGAAGTAIGHNVAAGTAESGVKISAASSAGKGAASLPAGKASAGSGKGTVIGKGTAVGKGTGAMAAGTAKGTVIGRGAAAGVKGAATSAVPISGKRDSAFISGAAVPVGDASAGADAVRGAAAAAGLPALQGGAPVLGKGIIYGKGAQAVSSEAAGIISPKDQDDRKKEENPLPAEGGGTLSEISKQYMQGAVATYRMRAGKAGRDPDLVQKRGGIRLAGGRKKTAEGKKETTTEKAAAADKPKQSILVGGEAKEDKKLKTERGLNEQGRNTGALSQQADAAKESGNRIRNFMAKHGFGTAPASIAQETAAPQAATKLKMLLQAAAKKAAVGLLTTSLVAGGLAGSAGFAGWMGEDQAEDLWTPLQAHVTIDGTEDGKSLTQDSLEKMYARMAAYGIQPYGNLDPMMAVDGGSGSAATNDVVQYALSWVGKISYGFGARGDLHAGGESDCSWFVYHVLKDCGVLSKDQGFIHSYEWGSKPGKYPGGTHIGNDLSKAQPGDVLCYAYSFPRSSHNSHVGIYIGDGRWVECSGHSGGVVNHKVSTHDLYQIVHFGGASSSSVAAGTADAAGTQTSSTSTTVGGLGTRYGFSQKTESIVEAHMNDFNYYTFDDFMRARGGAENYVRSLGGVFAKWCGIQAHVQSAGEFQEVAEYVMGIMTLWGPDYQGGGGKHKFNGKHGKGDEYGRFYAGQSVHRWWRCKPLEKVYFNDKEHIMTDCGCGAYYILQKAGLYNGYAGEDEKSDAWRKVDTSRGGTVVTRKEDLQVGDIVQMSKTKHEKGWGHVCVVGEVYPDGTVITYDTGNRYVNSGNYKKVFNPDSDGDFSGDYSGYHSWFAMRMRSLDQSDSVALTGEIRGPGGMATEGLKSIRINSVRVDGKKKNAHKFSYNSLGNYSSHGKQTLSVTRQFIFVDRNGNDITTTVLATGSTNDANKAKKEADKITGAAEKHMHAPFAYGGTDWKTGVDATHFVQKVLTEAGVYGGGEKTVSGWRSAGTRVESLASAQEGDVIVYANHVAIYDGKGKIYECSAATGGASHSRKAEEPGAILYIRRFTDSIAAGNPQASAGTGTSQASSGTGTSADTSAANGKGLTIYIPSGLGKVHTYMGWQCITAPSSNQYKLRSEAGMRFDSEGFGVIKGRYVIACTTTYGNVGDCVDFYKKNGQILHCVIGDIKSRNDAGCNKWGHHNGRNVIEFVVNKDTWYSNGRGSHINPGNPGCHPEWSSETVKAVNLGSWKNNPEVAHPTSVGPAISGSGTTPEEPLYLAKLILSMSATGSRVYEAPLSSVQYYDYCKDVLDYAICDAYGADVEYRSIGDYYWCTATVRVCCDPAKLEKNDTNFKSWEYKHTSGDPIVMSYMGLRDDIYNDVMNIDPSVLATMNENPFTGNEEIVYEFFRSKGLGPAQIAGIMANIRAESGFNPRAVNASSGASGLFQWLGGRLEKLKEMAKKQGKEWTDIQVQLEFAWEEISMTNGNDGWNGNKKQKDRFMKTNDPREAAIIFCTYWERPGSNAEALRRGDIARSYYTAIMRAMSPTGSGSTDYLQWAINIANDNSHGYSMAHRDGNPDYDCSSLVYYALKACGYNVGNSAFSTYTMENILPKAGFTKYRFSSLSELKPGDILLRHGQEHTEIYAGNGKNVGAHDNYDGKPGDSSGREISVEGSGTNWQYVFRTNRTTNFGGSGADVIRLLEEWRNSGGGHKQVVENYNKYADQWHVSKMDMGDEWCSETVSAAYAALGLANRIGGMSSDGKSYETNARKVGAWVSDRFYVPSTGDIIITHDSGGDSAKDRHTACVISCDGKTIKTIAGGGKSIHHSSISVGSSSISGFVVPRWNGTSTSDPVTPEPYSDVPGDNDWSVMIGRTLHGDTSRIQGKKSIVIDVQNYSASDIRKLKATECKVYSYLDIGSLEKYRDYYKDFKDHALDDYENWPEEKWMDVSYKKWQDFIVDKLAAELLDKGSDGFWLDNCDVYEKYHREGIYQGLLNIVTRLHKLGIPLYVNGGNKFVSRLIKEGQADLITGVMQEEVYSKILDYDHDKFARQDSDIRREHEAYLDRCKKAGIQAACLEYTDDPKLRGEIIKKCKEKGYTYYISSRVNLD